MKLLRRLVHQVHLWDQIIVVMPLLAQRFLLWVRLQEGVNDQKKMVAGGVVVSLASPTHKHLPTIRRRWEAARFYQFCWRRTKQKTVPAGIVLFPPIIPPPPPPHPQTPPPPTPLPSLLPPPPHPL